MYKEEKVQIRSKIDGWIKSGEIKADSDVYIFGVNDYAREIISYIGKYDIPVSGIADNDIKKQGSYCRGVKVLAPDDVNATDSIFIICSVFWREMCTQLAQKGVTDDRRLVIVLSTFCESFELNEKAFYEGEKIYSEIKREYNDSFIFLCPYTGTGDVYLIGTFIFEYIKRHGIDKYVLVVVSRPCEKVARIFGIRDIYRIDGLEACRALIKYYMVCPDECDMMILNDSWGDIYTNPTQWIRGLHGMDFSTMFRRFIFDFEDSVKPVHPVFEDAGDRIKELEDEYGLIKGKTVILAPYSTTLTDMPSMFWESIAEELRNDGWIVCTNSGGDEEPAIEGTRGVFFPLDIAPQFISWAGAFIGVRSGLCDVISGSTAKKIILYDNANYFFNCPAYDYFSLKKIGLSNDAVEICYDNSKLDSVKEQVLIEMKR